MSDEGKQPIGRIVVAFLVGVALAVGICLFVPQVRAAIAGGQQAPAQSAATSSNDTQAQAGFDNAHIDYSKTFPSWNKDSAALAELVSFVSNATDPASKGYVEPADRIATFDMDGTLICEKAPVYFDFCLTTHRVLDDPGFSATPEERSAMEATREQANQGKVYDPSDGPTKSDLVASAFAGMTPKDFRAYVNDFADKTAAVGFANMTYAQSFYKPMTEVVDYLRANQFDVWVVSACEREVTRAMVSRIGVPMDHVVATDVAYASTKQNGQVADKYNMGLDEDVVLSTPLDEVECGKNGKPLAIMREIGKRPILAFGNSSGDYAMLNFAEGNPEHKGMGVLVLCDDTTREYGDAERAKEQTEESARQGWTLFHMSDQDWATIYGEGVTKTQLPGAQEVAQQQAA